MTIALYFLLFGISFIFGILHVPEQVITNMTVLVNIPGQLSNKYGLGSIHASTIGEETPAPEPSAPPAPAPAPAKSTPAPSKPGTTKVEAKPATPVVQAPAPKPATPAKPEDKAYVPIQEPVVQAPAKTTTPTTVQSAEIAPAQTATASAADSSSAAEAAAEPWVPGARAPGSRQEYTSSSVYIPGKGLVPWSGAVTIHKAEAGSASDTYLGGVQGTVGHNLYVPVYYSFPLPRTVSAAVFNAIPDLVEPPKTVIYTAQERKKAFLMYYDFDGTAYRLKKDVDLDRREPLWQILEDARYDMANAEYKQGRNLNPVVIGFTVTKDKQLKGAEILQSSGDQELDKSILYGFKRASFWNKTGETVLGRFIYRF
jgi:TonB family protein